MTTAIENERQTECKITIGLPNSLAVEISTRVRAKRRKDPAYSRNDWFRNVLREYMLRHPHKDRDS